MQFVKRRYKVCVADSCNPAVTINCVPANYVSFRLRCPTSGAKQDICGKFSFLCCIQWYTLVHLEN